jgi:nucleoside-triphosphatase
LAPSVLLLTGRPGVGKTTAMRAVAAALAGRRLGGFLTGEIREAGERRGFTLTTFQGQEAVMAHVEFGGPHRVGRYGVDVEVIERLARAALAPGAEVYLVDEIGKMECCAPAFVEAMRRLLQGPAPLVATVAQRGGGFIAEARAWPGADLWEVTRANRDALPARVLDWLARRPG